MKWPEDNEKEYQEILEKRRMHLRRVDRRLKLLESIASPDVLECIGMDVDEGIFHVTITKVAPLPVYLETGYTPPRYVDQHSNGEDSYHGFIWYHLKNKHWVRMSFSC